MLTVLNASVVQKSFPSALTHQYEQNNIRHQYSLLTYTLLLCTSYIHTEIELVGPLPRTIRTTHLSYGLHIQFPVFSDCQLFDRLLWWLCELFPGRKRATRAPTSQECMHMITDSSWQWRSWSDRDFCITPFSIPLDCRTFCENLMNINSNPSDYCNTSFAGGGFSHTSKVRKRDQRRH